MKTLYTIYTSFAKRLALVLTLITLGVTSVWGAEYEEMLVLDVAKNAPTGSTTTAMEADAILSYLENASETNNEIKSVTDVSGKVYKGKGTGGDGIPQACLKIGKASEAAGFTFTIADTFDDVSKVTIIGYGWKTSTAVSVNESAGQKPTSAATEVSFDYILASPTKTIKIYVESSAFCATQIILYKEAAPQCAYTVTFNSNDGTNSTSSQEFTCGETKALTANSFSRTGYTFTEWNTLANGSGDSYTDEEPVSNLAANGETITLFAQWTAKTSTISFDQNGGEGGQTATVTATYDQPMPTPITLPTRYGHTFGGYYDGVGGTGTQYYTAEGASTRTWDKTSADITLYAKWTEKDLTNYRTTCSTKADPNLSWSASTCIATMEVDNDFPTLTNSYDLSVNYSSSDPTIATIDEKNGTITLLKAGTTTITASYDEDEDYLSASASYTLTVKPSNCRWVEVTDNATLEDGDWVVITMTKGNYTYALPNEENTSAAPSTIHVDDIVGNIIDNVLDLSKWIVEKSENNYIFHPANNGALNLYCNKADDGVRVGSSSNAQTNHVFSVSDNYLLNNATSRYLGVSLSTDTWRCYTVTTGVIKDQSLKFYKKTCLPADEYWINYNLSNVTCTTDPIVQKITATTEVIQLMFAANDGYVLPEDIDVQMVGSATPLSINWNETTGSLNIHKPTDGFTGNITISIAGCKALAAPKNMSVQDIKSSSVRLSWDAVNDAQSYRVFVTDFNDHDIEIKDIEDCFVEVTGLKQYTTYTWDVTAFASDYDCQIPSELSEFTTLQTYTVTFNTDGGTAVESQTVDHGSKATKPANPTKTGYTFAGWYTEADTEFDFNTPITSATTLYAKWNANQYTITFRQQWGNGGTETATVHFNNNDFSVNPIIVPTRNGYTFGGYYTAESGAGTQLIDVSGAWLNAPTYIEGGKWVYADDLTLYAKWTQNFTITWMANGQLYHTQTAMMGTAIAKPDDPNANELACDDKVFVGWLDKTISGSTNEEPTFVTDFGTIQANKTYYAVFAKLTGTPSNDYNKITDINDLTDGEYVIAYGYETSSPSIILKAEAKDATKLAATSATPTNNKYTSPAAANIWEIKKNGDNYSIYNAATQKYVEATTTPSVGLSDNPEYYTISWNSSYSYWKIQIADFPNYWFVGYIAGETKYFQSYDVANNKYRIQLYKNASTAVYSDYVTTCVEIPTPHWEGAEIDNANIAVDCGTISYKTNASTITFPTDKNYDLTYPITLTASEGFLLSTNKQNDIYEQSVTVTPVQSNENKGKITQSVYVRADATGKNTNFDGTITISGDQLAEDQIIEVHAVVDCPQYTLTFNDCGDTKTISNFAGTSVEEMESWAETCSEPFQYVFDGWAIAPVTNGTEEYEKVDFSTFTMPNNNTTILYAVYRYAEEGGEPVNGYVKVTEALSDWSGDYVIVDDENLFAIKNAYRENTTSNKTLAGETVTIENDKVVSPSANIVWSFSKNGNGYTMYNDANKMYAGVTGNSTTKAILSSTTDENSIFTIIFENETQIAKVSAITYTRCFRYYESGDVKEWRTYDSNQSQYNTGYLYRLSNKTIRYTSSLVCRTIEAEDAIVTSTVGQIVKVNVPITLGYSGAASITGTSDNEAFTVVTKNDVAVGESNIEVHYKPTAYVNTANQEETATITLTTSNAATTTFNITGRCLPETFAIVAKVGNIWYALPSQGLNSGTTPVGYPVEVDNNDNPTAVTSVPANADWSLRQVLNDRFTANGENLVFVNAENKTLYASKDNANIQTYAEYTDYAATNPERYEWVPTTTDLTNYTLKNVGRDKDLSINVNATFGTHASNIASNNLRFLPINATYNPFDMQVVEWYPTKVLVQTETALTSVSATVGGVAVAKPGVTKKGGKLYEISGLPLESNPTKILTISYDTYSCSKVIPIIISCEDKTVTDAPFSTLTTSAYNYSDLVVRDGATLTINGTKQAPDKFVNVTIYPTAKIVVPENKQLSVYSLTFFGGIDDIYDGSTYTTNKYGVPQLSLKGTLGKTVPTVDYIMRVDLDQMYQVGVPYNVDLSDVTYWDGTQIDFGTQLYVSAYDGQARANLDLNNTWIWEVDFAEKVLKAGVGYTISAEPQLTGDEYSILRMPMKSNISSGSTEGAKTINVVAYDNQKSVAITDNHKGWNYLSNPYMTAISGGEADSELVLGYLKETGTGPWEWVNDEIRYVTIPHDDGEDYYQKKFSEAVLKPFKSFFVQIATNGDLSFALTSRQNAPARYMEVQTEQEVEFEILLSNDKQSDNTGLLIAEQYSPAYEINADLEKMIGSMSVYTIYGGYNLAYNALSPINASEWIPMGYVAPAAGEYTLSLDDVENIAEQVEHVYIIDYNANNIVDLMDEEYKFTTDKEQNDNRFAINVVLVQDKDNTTTGLDMIQGNNAAPIKFIYQDKMYIYNDGIIYDATGKQVTNINK